jgi:small nuclear ribonucleoprotein (snRNP)-like protein
MTGLLIAYDEHMNLMLADAVETVVMDGAKDVQQL